MADWTDEEIKLLTALWEDGLSAGVIAMQFDGKSRNAIIGKISRLGMVRNKKGPRVTLTPAPRTTRRPNPQLKSFVSARSALPAEPEPEPESQNRSLLSLGPNDCRWPHGDGPYTFCGNPIAHDATPYCPHHTVVAMRK